MPAVTRTVWCAHEGCREHYHTAAGKEEMASAFPKKPEGFVFVRNEAGLFEVFCDEHNPLRETR